VAAVGLRVGSSGVSAGIVFGLFCAGALIAGLALVALDTQHSYYRAARSLTTRLERALELGAFSLQTTPGMGSLQRRLGRVTTFQKLMMWALLTAHALGATVIAVHAITRPPAPVRVLVRVEGIRTAIEQPPVVMSSGGSTEAGKIVASGVLGSGSLVLRVRPGVYRVWTVGTRVCHERVVIDDRPIQAVTLNCPN
jgi:hypothetical protein